MEDNVLGEMSSTKVPVDSTKDVKKKKFVSVMITDFSVFDCSVCFQPLTIPVFQCYNGHAVCSTCCPKLRNKCATCLMPIRSRCKGVEKIIQSLILPCENAKNGCKEKIRYSEKRKHRKECIYVPCCYSLLGCDCSHPKS